jgi:hypothetical protein
VKGASALGVIDLTASILNQLLGSWEQKTFLPPLLSFGLSVAHYYLECGDDP